MIPVLAGYLIAAQSIDPSKELAYVKSFSDIPLIHVLLYRIQESNEYKKMCAQVQKVKVPSKRKATECNDLIK